MPMTFDRHGHATNREAAIEIAELQASRVGVPLTETIIRAARAGRLEAHEAALREKERRRAQD